MVALSVFAAQGQTTCVQPPAGAIAWWSFDETSGNIASDRLGQSPGAWTNGPVPVPGEVREALSFNGSSYVTVPDSALWNLGASDFTIELWANFSAAPGGSVGEPGAILIANDEGPENRNKWFFAVGGGYLYFHINSPTLGPQFFPLVPFSPTVGQWYHLAVVRTGSTYTVFINGVASGTATNANVIADPNAPLTMGEGEDIGHMLGSLDEVTVYDRGLLPGEIAAVYNAASSGKCVSLQVSPAAGGDTGNVSVNINGVGFQQGATVSLAQTGQTSIAGSSATVGGNGTTIATTFSLAGQTDGAWDVVVTNPDGTSTTLPQGFTIKPGTDPQIWVDIVGIGLIVPGRAQAVQIFYGNSGNVDAVGVPLWIDGVPPDATLNLGFNLLPPLPLTDPTSDFSQIPTSLNTGTDTVGAFLVPVVAAGSTGALQVSITIPELEDFLLEAWANPPWFGTGSAASSVSQLSLRSKSDLRLMRSLSESAEPLDDYSTGDLLGCSLAILDKLYPNGEANTACVQGELQAYENLLTDEAELKTEGKIGLEDTVNTFWALIHGAYQCGYAATCDVCTTPVAGEFIPESCIVCEAPRFWQDVNNAYSDYGSAKACANVAYQAIKSVLQMIAIISKDPNSKAGPQGSGTARYVAGQAPLHYSVSFENDPTATAPAQKVFVTDQLDPTKVDLSTVSLGPIAFGSYQVVPPPNSTTFATTVSLQPVESLNVQITGSLDPNTGLLTWIFASIEPTTGNPPTNPAVGFLPPDVTPPQGDGSVLFTVMPKKGLATGTQFTNQATIVFDTNAPIATPTWMNTLDATPPTSTVNPLPATEVAVGGSTATFPMSWSGTDTGSGIATYTIYVSDNGGGFTAWQTATTQSSASFTGTAGHTYGFYSIATDNVGNVEAGKSTADTATKVTQGTPVAATLTSPVSGTALPGPSETFIWSAVTGATAYSLWLGSTGVGSFDLFHSGAIAATSATAKGLPTNGATIYARLNTIFSNGVAVHVDYTYTAVTEAALAIPVPGSVLAGPTVTFSWTSSAGATAYSLWLGSTGVGSHDLYHSGAITATSATAAGLPTNGEKIYARINTIFDGVAKYVDYTYTAATEAQSALTSPTPGSTLTGSNVTFLWTATAGATAYSLWLGSTGVGSNNLYNSHATTTTTVTANGLPTNGETIYARLNIIFNGVAKYVDYTYTASGTPPAAAITRSVSGNMLTSSSAAFE